MDQVYSYNLTFAMNKKYKKWAKCARFSLASYMKTETQIWYFFFIQQNNIQKLLKNVETRRIKRRKRDSSPLTTLAKTHQLIHNFEQFEVSKHDMQCFIWWNIDIKLFKKRFFSSSFTRRQVSNSNLLCAFKTLYTKCVLHASKNHTQQKAMCTILTWFSILCMQKCVVSIWIALFLSRLDCDKVTREILYRKDGER